MEKRIFGTLPCGKDVSIYTLKNDKATLELMDRGATVVRFNVFGTDIVGGFDTLDDYLADTSHQGATIGRVANRIGGAHFTMDGAVYMVTENDHGNCLHGGDGFDHRLWDVKEITDTSVTFSYTAKDGEEGFPSEVYVEVRFTLCGASLRIDYEATPYGKTPLALTNHSYFNLDGFGGNILNHTATIYANNYTQVDSKLIPNGVRPAVVGTPFDFTTPHKIGERVGGDFAGYDHNFVLATTEKRIFNGKELGLAAKVDNKKLELSVYTDQPGVQFYIGNFLGSNSEAPRFRGGVAPVKHGAFCLETQTEPNCINHGIGFYDEGEKYTHTVVYEIEKL